MKTYKLDEYEVNLYRTHYVDNDAFALIAVCTDGEVYGTLTVNLNNSMPTGHAFVDTNSCANYEQFIVDNNLGKPTGKIQKSGFCTYPEYIFNPEDFPLYLG